jgi:hypothetical protein
MSSNNLGTMVKSLNSKLNGIVNNCTLGTLTVTGTTALEGSTTIGTEGGVGDALTIIGSATSSSTITAPSFTIPADSHNAMFVADIRLIVYVEYNVNADILTDYDKSAIVVVKNSNPAGGVPAPISITIEGLPSPVTYTLQAEKTVIFSRTLPTVYTPITNPF